MVNNHVAGNNPWPGRDKGSGFLISFVRDKLAFFFSSSLLYAVLNTGQQFLCKNFKESLSKYLNDQLGAAKKGLPGRCC